VAGHFALHFGQRGQFLAFGLADIKHVHGTEANELLLWPALVRCIVSVNFGRDFVLARPAVADHRGKNQDAFFASFDEAAKRVPCTDTCDVSCLWFLPSDQHDVAKAVVMKPGHRVEILGQDFTLSRLQSCHQIATTRSESTGRLPSSARIETALADALLAYACGSTCLTPVAPRPLVSLTQWLCIYFQWFTKNYGIRYFIVII